MWRQGDILIAGIDAVPAEGLRRVRSGIVAVVAATGHEHRLEDRKAGRLYAVDARRPCGDLFLRVTTDAARIVHPDHGAIVLPRGSYRLWRVREYQDRSLRSLID